MRKTAIHEIEEGTILAKPVLRHDGSEMLMPGTQITVKSIKQLAAKNISEVYVTDNIFEDIEVPYQVCEQTKHKGQSHVRRLVDSCFTSVSKDSDKIKQLINSVMDYVLEDVNVLKGLHYLKLLDDYTFGHSLNVAIYSIATANELAYAQEDLRELGIGAVLHDIGKLKIPETILKKPAQLTVDEFNKVKKHTVFGCEFLKGLAYRNISPAYIAMTHHERCDGTGYPRRLKADDIEECVRIVMIADVYDALTSDRVYRSRQSPDAVMGYINDLGMHQFDKNMVNCFKKSIAIYPVGTGVVLNTMEKAMVLKVNVDMPTRPVICLVYDEQGNRLSDYKEVDLSKEWSLFIVDSYDL